MSYYVIIDGELYHHGVKGMKWGVRKDRLANKAKRVALRIRNAHAIEKDRKLQYKQSRLVVSNRKNAGLKLKKLERKRAKLKVLMDRSVSTLTPKEINKGVREYQIGKSLAKIGLGVAVGALVTDIANNGGIRRIDKVIDSKTDSYSAHDHNLNLDYTSTATFEKTQRHVQIGRWAIPTSADISTRYSRTSTSTYADGRVSTITTKYGH